jgi:hypothetical protein
MTRSLTSSTYVREIRPQIRVSFCDMNLRTGILSRSCHLRKIHAYASVFTVRKFALFPTVPIKYYYEELARYQTQGVTHELAVKTALQMYWQASRLQLGGS